MKPTKLIVLLILTQGLYSSCSKNLNSFKTIPLTAITVVNAVVNSSPLLASFATVDNIAVYYSTAPQIGYGSFLEFSIPSGNTPITVYQSSDTTSPFYKNNLRLDPQRIYTLFLSGIVNGHNQIDTLLTQDHPPYHSMTDSSVGIRFVNLSSGSNPLSINIQGNANGSEVNNLPYRNITSFKTYPATANISQYVFEIREAASDSLLTTFLYTIAPFQNVTLVVNNINSGVGSNSISTFLVNDF